jgi:hypothetical protein
VTSVTAGAVLVPELVAVFPTDSAPEYDSPKRTNFDVADKLTVMVFTVLAPVEMAHHFSIRHKVPLLIAMELDGE